MPYLILVDYDNLDKSDKQRGLVYLCERIVGGLASNELNSFNVQIRLYGGWYQSQTLTRTAQHLSNEIIASFPITASVSDYATRVVVNAELAYSLITQPNMHLFNTFRIRGIPFGLNCFHPQHRSCQEPDCHLLAVYDFIKNDVCALCNRITPADLFYRNEQKLVDTMITSDLIYAAKTARNVCLVSSDDDFWPGILTALNFGVKVIQMHTKGKPTPQHYSRMAKGNYIQKQL